MPRFTLAALFALAAALPAAGADPFAELDRVAQKLAGAGKTRVGRAETERFRVTAATDAQAKSVADAAECGFTSAARALKLKPDAVKGAVGVYVFPDAKVFKQFSLQALKRAPAPGVLSDVRLRGDNPTVTYAPADKAAGPDEAAALVAGGLVAVKAGDGAAPPPWLEAGFGRAAVLRGDKQDAKLAAHRAKVRALAARTGGRAFAFRNVWGDNPDPDAELLATSAADYLAFGPAAAKFPDLVAALKPTEARPEPTIDAAFEAAGLDMPETEAAWRKWAAGGGK